MKIIDHTSHERQASELAGTLGLVDVDHRVGRNGADVGQLSLLLLLAAIVGDSSTRPRIEPDAVEHIGKGLLAIRCGDLLRLY